MLEEGRRPGEGHNRCGWQGCANWEVDGLEYCVRHVPDDLLEEAEEVTGIRRCRTRFGETDACRGIAVAGTHPPACKNHGANIGTPVWKAAVRNTFENEMTERLAEIMKGDGGMLMMPPPISDPLVELLDLAAEVRALKEVLRLMAAKLISETRVRYAHAKVGEQLRIEILLYERSVERFAKILIDIGKLRIEDRLAGVQEATAVMMEQALDEALEESGVGLDGKSGARRAFRRRLKVIQGTLAS